MVIYCTYRYSFSGQTCRQARIHHSTVRAHRAAESTEFERLRLRLRLRPDKIDSDSDSDSSSDSDLHEYLFPIYQRCIMPGCLYCASRNKYLANVPTVYSTLYVQCTCTARRLRGETSTRSCAGGVRPRPDRAS